MSAGRLEHFLSLFASYDVHRCQRWRVGLRNGKVPQHNVGDEPGEDDAALSVLDAWVYLIQYMIAADFTEDIRSSPERIMGGLVRCAKRVGCRKIEEMPHRRQLIPSIELIV